MKVDPITVVVPSPAQPPVAPSKPRNKKKKSKCTSDRSSSQRSPKRLKETTPDPEMSFTFNFLNKKIMVADRVNLSLKEYEKNQFASPSRAVLRNALMEAQACALLLGRLVGEELLMEDTKKLRKELAETTSSLDSSWNDIAKLKAENQTCRGEIVSLKKTVDTIYAENNSLRERCLATEKKRKGGRSSCGCP